MTERTRITTQELSDWVNGKRPKSLLKTRWLARPDISIMASVSKSKIVYIANLGVLGMPKNYGSIREQGKVMLMYAMDEVAVWLRKSDVTEKLPDKQKPEKTKPGIDNTMAVEFLSRKRVVS